MRPFVIIFACVWVVSLAQDSNVWVQILVTDNDVKIGSIRAVDKYVHPESDHKWNRYQIENGSVLSSLDVAYDVSYGLQGKIYHVHRAANPRVVIGDWLGNDGKLSGKIHQLYQASFSVTVPREVKELFVSPIHQPGKVHKLQLPVINIYRHSRMLLEDKPNTTWSYKQTVGRVSEHKNIVFISAGYSKDQKDRFDSDVQTCVDFLRTSSEERQRRGDPRGALTSEPYRRYFSLLNIFQLWLADNQAGVSNPFRGIDKPNTMGCTYGSTEDNERFLQCDETKVKWIGSYAPPREEHTVYVVLVNDITYGGSGTARVAVLSRKSDDMLGLLIHEIGHADGRLLDEYDYKYNEPKQLPNLPNCHYSTDGVPWKYWIDKGVLSAPVQQCSYSNYYKPSNGKCLMFSNTVEDNYCAACLEQMVLSITKDIVDVTAPRCPLNLERTYVEITKSVTIITNTDYLANTDVSVSIIWKENNVDITRYFIKQNGTLSIPASDLGVGNHTFEFTIIDKTPSVRPTTEIKRTQQYLVNVYQGPRPASCNPKRCTFGRDVKLTENEYCTSCGNPLGCDIQYTAVPVDLQGLGAVVQKLQDFIMSMGLIIVGGIMLFFCIFCCCGRIFLNRKRDIVRQPKIIKAMRTIMLASSVLNMFISLILLGYGVYMYQQMDSFGKTLIIILICFASAIYVIAFIGFVATFYRSRVLMGLNGVLLLILLLGAIAGTVFIKNFQQNVKTEKWKKTLGDNWVSLVQNHPQEICSVQKAFRCSGFFSGCNLVSTSSYCPKDCEVQNKNVEPCYDFLTNYVQGYFGTAFWIGLVICIFFFFAVIFDFLYCCSIRRKDKIVKAMHKAPGLEMHASPLLQHSY